MSVSISDIVQQLQTHDLTDELSFKQFLHFLSVYNRLDHGVEGNRPLPALSFISQVAFVADALSLTQEVAKRCFSAVRAMSNNLDLYGLSEVTDDMFRTHGFHYRLGPLFSPAWPLIT